MAEEALGLGEILYMLGEYNSNPSYEGLLFNNESKGINFKHTDITIFAVPYDCQIDVAGYTTEPVELYFVHTINNGILEKTVESSALYGAKYNFEAKNLEEMTNDLVNKLSSVYGEPEKNTSDIDWIGNQYTYYQWYGENNTGLSLISEKISDDFMSEYSYDSITISYAWENGDELLQAADDCRENEEIDAEASSYGSSDVNGL